MLIIIIKSFIVKPDYFLLFLERLRCKKWICSRMVENINEHCLIDQNKYKTQEMGGKQQMKTKKKEKKETQTNYLPFLQD